MIVNNQILVRLLPKEFNFNGTKAVFDLETGKLKTEHMNLDLPTTATNDSPAYFILTEGIVLESDNPEIPVGSIAHLEFLEVAYALGRWFEPKATSDDCHFILNGKWNNLVSYPEMSHLHGLNVLVKDTSCYWVDINGEERAVNNVSVIKELYKEASVTIKVMQKVKTGYAEVLIGEHKGETVIYRKDLTLGSSQHLLRHGEPVSIINNQYLLAVIETTNTNEQ